MSEDDRYTTGPATGPAGPTPFDNDYPPLVSFKKGMDAFHAEISTVNVLDLYRRPAPTLEILERRIDALEREVHELQQARLSVRLRRRWLEFWREW